MRYKRLRTGIAMIELIFAIVIMAIVLMSAPMLISQASKGSLVVVQQEAIVAASTDLGMILTRHWDEQDTNESLESPILLTVNPVELAEALFPDGNATGKRAGTPLLSYRSFLTSLGNRLPATPAANFVAEGDFDDIDDYQGQGDILLDVDGTNERAQDGNYMDTSLRLNTTVAYINDQPSAMGSYNAQAMSLNSPFATAPAVAGATSNIKSVSINVTSANPDVEITTNITLNAFSCNIGTYKLEERNF